jgi:hypothetical protein
MPLIVAKKIKKPKLVLKAFQPVAEEEEQPVTQPSVTVKPKRKLVIV